MNIQPIEKRVTRTDGLLDVHSIFYTIQGEGPFCGTPCVFLRLAGCNLQCPGCDTDYTSGRQHLDVGQIVQAIITARRGPWGASRLVVITGGEPFRQPIRPLLEALVAADFYVQIESNGTLPPAVWDYEQDPFKKRGVYIVCSPKTGKINPILLGEACALKYVVRYAHMEEDGLPTSALNHVGRPARPPANWDRPIYIQPMDERDVAANDMNMATAVNSCLEHGYTLQLQIHKIIGVE